MRSSLRMSSSYGQQQQRRRRSVMRRSGRSLSGRRLNRIDPPAAAADSNTSMRSTMRKSVVGFFALPDFDNDDDYLDEEDEEDMPPEQHDVVHPNGGGTTATTNGTTTNMRMSELTTFSKEDNNNTPMPDESETSVSLLDDTTIRSFLKQDDGPKDMVDVLSCYWRYCVLTLSVMAILGIRHVTSGYWKLPVLLFSPFYVFLLFEISMELAGLRFNRVLWLVSSLAVIIWYWSNAQDNTSLDYIVLPTALLSIAFFSLGLSDCYFSGEKFLVYVLVLSVVLGSVGFNKVANHPCLPCASQMPAIVKEYLVPKPGDQPQDLQQYGTTGAWRFLLGDSPVPKECGMCYSTLTTFAESTTDAVHHYRLDDYQFIREKLAESGLYELVQIDREFDAEFQDDDTCLEDFDNSISSMNLRVMDEWYNDLKAKSLSKTGSKKFVDALMAGLSTKEGSEMLGNVVEDLLCSPSSRMGPPPSDFLLNIERPRYTGESSGMDKPMNITLNKLRGIMRGDKLAELGPDICFLVRTANVIPEDITVLNNALNPSNIAPVMNEQELKGDEVSFLFPALYVPRTDEDNDRDGARGDLFEALLSFYQQLPLKDWEPTFFETKEQYLAFFRWNVEHTLQDEYYFPKWIAHASSHGLGEGEDDDTEDLNQITYETGKLVADQFKHMNDRLALTNPTSDETLSDRAFFGTGMKTITRIKLPMDDDYGFLHPVGPNYFESEEHRDFFRNEGMPSAEELKRMGNQFWTEKKKVPLEEYLKRVVQVDHAILAHWKHRDIFEEGGSILYLDAETRKPMGIWVASMHRIVLPTEERLWEYAKFYHRSTELKVMAMRHVAEFHIGWANTFSTAVRQALPQNHGLRAFLKPYIHGTGSVDWVAYQMLLLDNSILHRASGNTRRARGFSWGHIQKHLNFTATLPMILESKKLDGISNLTKDIPMFTNGIRLWNVHRSFTEGYINLMYPDDESLQSDTHLYRFWNHINTFGRHTDPCVCGMDDAAFFESGSWPAFEESRTCSGLLDHQRFLVDEEGDDVRRRQKWCKRHPIERTRALYNWLVDDCEADTKCPGLSYEFYHMRSDMGLPPINRKVLIDVLTMFMNEVTVGHEMAADNIPYMVDPAYGGVRIPRQDPDGDLPLMVDIGTYVCGTVISALTTIRSNPLLSDWSHLLVHWMDDDDDTTTSSLDNQVLSKKKKQVRKLHLKYKLDLIKLSNEFMKESLTMPKNRWAPYMIPATQASSVAV